MNQDFTVQKKINICLRKKLVQRGSPEKKNPAQAVSEKQNSCKLKIPPPPHHFSHGPSLSCRWATGNGPITWNNGPITWKRLDPMVSLPSS